jgi:hypothetical protein
MSQLWKDPEFLDLVKKMKASGGGQSGLRRPAPAAAPQSATSRLSAGGTDVGRTADD